MTVDSHVHYGKGSSWGDFTPEDLLEIIRGEADIVICSNLEGIDSVSPKSELECNLDMLAVSKKYPVFKPLAVCEVNKEPDAGTLEKLLSRNSEFAGLKFHPEYMKLPANSSKYDSYLETARKFKKPCLYHSGHIKSRFSSPALIYEKAKQFPDVPIILGHLSTGPRESHLSAIEILIDSIENNRALLYVDTSWIDFPYESLNETMEDTLMLIRALRNTSRGDFTNRILWGTDAPVGKFNHTNSSYKKNLETFKLRVMEEFKDEELLNGLLDKNARELYKI